MTNFEKFERVTQLLLLAGLLVLGFRVESCTRAALAEEKEVEINVRSDK